MPPQINPSQVVRTNQILTLAVASFLVVIGVIIVFTLPGADLTMPPVLVPVGQVVLGAIFFVACNSIGFRTDPIDPATEPDKIPLKAFGGYQTMVFLRMALSEITAVVSIVLALVLPEGQLITYVVGALVSIALIGWFVYPSARNVRRSEAQLDAAGVRSGLSGLFGLDEAPMGTERL